MFVVIVHFPAIREGREARFLEWFTRSNEKFSGLDGFLGRRLLKASDGRSYAAVIETESREAFVAIQCAPAHDEAARQVASLLDGTPAVEQYEVVLP